MANTTATVEGIAARLGRDPVRSAPHHFNPRHFAARQPAPAQPAEREVNSLGIIFRVCCAFMAFTAMILGAVWLLGAEISRAGHSSDTGIKQLVIGNDVLGVPGNIIRFRSQRRWGALERADLYLLWPQMEGYSEAGKDQFNGTTLNPAILFITIERRQMSQDMTGRIEPIYSKFLAGSAVNAGHGLMRRGLSAEGGFHNEDLWFEANSPYPFAARCTRPGDGSAAPYCLRDIHFGRNLSVTYRFHLSLIGEWMAIEAAIRAQMNQMLEG